MNATKLIKYCEYHGIYVTERCLYCTTQQETV